MGEAGLEWGWFIGDGGASIPDENKDVENDHCTPLSSLVKTKPERIA